MKLQRSPKKALDRWHKCRATPALRGLPLGPAITVGRVNAHVRFSCNKWATLKELSSSAIFPGGSLAIVTQNPLTIHGLAGWRSCGVTYRGCCYTQNP